jgi:hypothetical protein
MLGLQVQHGVVGTRWVGGWQHQHLRPPLLYLLALFCRWLVSFLVPHEHLAPLWVARVFS